MRSDSPSSSNAALPSPSPIEGDDDHRLVRRRCKLKSVTENCKFFRGFGKLTMFGFRRHGMSLAMAALAIVAAVGSPAEAQWFRRFVNAFRPLPVAPPNAPKCRGQAGGKPMRPVTGRTRSLVLPDNTATCDANWTWSRKQIEGGLPRRRRPPARPVFAGRHDP